MRDPMFKTSVVFPVLRRICSVVENTSCGGKMTFHSVIESRRYLLSSVRSMTDICPIKLC